MDKVTFQGGNNHRKSKEALFIVPATRVPTAHNSAYNHFGLRLTCVPKWRTEITWPRGHTYYKGSNY